MTGRRERNRDFAAALVVGFGPSLLTVGIMVGGAALMSTDPALVRKYGDSSGLSGGDLVGLGVMFVIITAIYWSLWQFCLVGLVVAVAGIFVVRVDIVHDAQGSALVGERMMMLAMFVPLLGIALAMAYGALWFGIFSRFGFSGPVLAELQRQHGRRGP